MLEIIVKYKEHQDWIITYTEKDIIGRLRVGTQTESDSVELNFAPVPQYGSFSVYDKNNFVYNKISNQEFDVYGLIKVQILLDNNIIFTNNAQINYNLVDKIIDFTITDNISTWDLIQFPGFSFIQIFQESTEPSCGEGGQYAGYLTGKMCIPKLDARDIYERLQEETPEIFASLLDRSYILTWLESIKLYVPQMKPCSLMEAWTQFCELTLLNLCRNNLGQLTLIANNAVIGNLV